jgi:hypothetical protein
MVIGFITITNQIQESYHDFNLGLATKARAWKGVNRECNLGITFIFGKKIHIIYRYSCQHYHFSYLQVLSSKTFFNLQKNSLLT